MRKYFDQKKYTFEGYVESESTKAAKAALMEIAASMDHTASPIVLHGVTSTGKSHLLQAAKNHMEQLHPEAKTKYLDGNSFINAFIDALTNCQLKAFYQGYYELDALFLDDVQDLEGKEPFQEALLKIFNVLFASNKVMVFACDRSPEKLYQLDRQLRIRLICNQIIEVEHADEEAKLKILMQKANELGLSEEEIQRLESVFDVFIEKAGDDVRALIGYLKRVSLFAELMEEELDKAFALKVIDA